ncbi:MAG: hypothetical protein H6898_12370 [Rhodobacter sp.]|nr:hypothetical protein [Rhodobacter sp.]
MLRDVGFQSFIRESAPEFTVLDALVNLETRQFTYVATLDVLRRRPDLRGLYIAGGGMEGAIAALRELRLAGKVALVVNEITTDSRAALADRYVSMVIATPLADLCRATIGSMVRLARRQTASQRKWFLEPRIYLPEMV